MKILLKLEPPTNLRVNSVNPGAVTLNWDLVEDIHAYEEIEVYARKHGDSEWKLAGIAPNEATSIALTQPFSQEEGGFESGQSYEFCVQSYGPRFPVGPGDSDYSNIVSATMP